MIPEFVLPPAPSRHELEATAALRTELQDRFCELPIEIRISAGLSAEAPHRQRGAYFVRQRRERDKLLVELTGEQEGALYAAYAWLRRQGWVFQLAGDSSPSKDRPISCHEFSIERTPRFAWRGLQLWNFWWPGRDSWAFEDYKSYIDQFPKLALNQFDFPLYWYEPLFTGVRFTGVPLRRLPLSGVDVSLARIGRDALSGMGRFTSPDIPEHLGDDARHIGARDLLRRVLAYARSKGLRTNIGIEIANLALIDPLLLKRLPPEDLYEGGLLVQPSSPTGKALAQARLTALFEAFPDEDIYSIWQSEMGVWRTTSGSPHVEDVAFRQAFSHYADNLEPGDFDQLQWLRISADISKTLKPGAMLSTGGWGAERLMIAADEVLPNNMIRSTIADYEPEFGLRRNAFDAYTKTKGPKGHTTWAEVDQHLWIQQPKVSATLKVLDNLERTNVESVSMLHWRLLFPEPDLHAFVEGCWDSSLTADTLLQGWSESKFGPAAGPHAAKAMKLLQRFNELIVEQTPDILHSAWWVGFDCHMGGLLAANRYLDGNPISNKFIEENIEPLLLNSDQVMSCLREASAELQKALEKPATPVENQRLRFWANRAKYSHDLYYAHLEIAKAVKLAGRAVSKHDYERALAHIHSADAGRVVTEFAERLGENDSPERGELGLLLSLNIKFLGSVRRLEGAIRRCLSEEELPPIRGEADVRAGINLPRKEYATFFELLHVSTTDWTRDADYYHLPSEFDYEVLRGTVGKLSPREGVWSDPVELELAIKGPPGWSGKLGLYFYQELDWDTPFRKQDVFVEDSLIGTVQDFHSRGEFFDEGVWLECATSFPDSGLMRVRIKRCGGGDARLSAFFLAQG